MKSSQANKINSTKSKAKQIFSTINFFLFSSIAIEGARADLAIFFNCVLKRS